MLEMKLTVQDKKEKGYCSYEVSGEHCLVFFFSVGGGFFKSMTVSP